MTDQQVEAAGARPRVAHLIPRQAPVEHVMTLVERGPFVVAVCAGCGWETFARRSRPLARSEGQDHMLLHRPPTEGGPRL